MLHKGILVAHLDVAGSPVVVVNTHLLANYSADWSEHNGYARQQRAELHQLVQVLNEVGHDPLVTVVGDFNVPSGASIYQEFVRASALQDILGEKPEPTYRCPSYWPDRYVQALDHVLVRPPSGSSAQANAHLVFRDKTRLVDGKLAYLSDHFGIEAHIEYTEQPTP
jgi:endonuclease/exonuclease/phosphatase family metal-dependent hydrolase